MRNLAILLPVLLGTLPDVAAESAPRDASGSVTFAVVGDVPYLRRLRAPFERDLASIPGHPAPALFIHLGDIGDGPCSGALHPCAANDAVQPCDEPAGEPVGEPHAYLSGQLRALEGRGIPVLVLPGDNETVDCSEDPGAAWRLWDDTLGRFAGGGERRRDRNVAITRGDLRVLGLSLPNPDGGERDAALDHLERELRSLPPEVKGVLIAAHSFKAVRAELPALLARVALPVLLVQGDKHQLFWGDCPCLAPEARATSAARQLLVVGGELDYCGVALVRFDGASGRFAHDVASSCVRDEESCYLCRPP